MQDQSPELSHSGEDVMQSSPTQSEMQRAEKRSKRRLDLQESDTLPDSGAQPAGGAGLRNSSPDSSGFMVASSVTPESRTAASILLSCSAQVVAPSAPDSATEGAPERGGGAAGDLPLAEDKGGAVPDGAVRTKPQGCASLEDSEMAEAQGRASIVDSEMAEAQDGGLGDLPNPEPQGVSSTAEPVITKPLGTAAGDIPLPEEDVGTTDVEMIDSIRDDTMKDLREMSPEADVPKVNPLIAVPHPGLTHAERLSLKNRFEGLLDLPLYHARSSCDYTSKASRIIQATWEAHSVLYKSILDIASDHGPQVTEPELAGPGARLPAEVCEEEVTCTEEERRDASGETLRTLRDFT